MSGLYFAGYVGKATTADGGSVNGYGRGGDTHRCQKDPRIFSRVAWSLINGKASSCAQQVSQLHSPSRASSLSSRAEQTEWRWENSWSSKNHKKRNHFLNVCYLTVKNYGPAFSLLNNKEKKKMECLLIVFVPGAMALVLEALM